MKIQEEDKDMKKIFKISLVVFLLAIGWFVFNIMPYYNKSSELKNNLDKLNSINQEQVVLIEKVLHKFPNEEVVKHLIRVQSLYSDYDFDNYLEKKEISNSLSIFKEEMFGFLSRNTESTEAFFIYQKILFNEGRIDLIHDQITKDLTYAN